MTTPVGALLALVALTSVAHAVEVRVVEVAGGRAYLEPGEDGGVRAGTIVTIDGRKLTVVSATRKHAVVEGDGLAAGAIGEADATAPAGAPRTERLPTPAPLSSFKGQWADPVPPSTRGPARFVPLGAAARRRDVRATILAQAMITAPDGDASFVLGGEAHVEPWRDRPLGFDADAALLLWVGDTDGPNRRPLLRVRELRLRYGGEREPLAALGRLRGAAQTVGLLDGARVSAPIGRGLSLAAFGGLVPDPIDGAPSTDSSRFGVEATWAPDRSPWAHRVDVTAHGSIWDGALDERRVAAQARAFPGDAALGAHVELSGFDVPNAWGAPAWDLTAAGVDAAWRSDGLRVSARLDARQPERSRFLASLLPEGWLCADADAATGDVGCAGDRELRVLGAASAGLTRGRLSLDAGGALIGASAGSVFGDVRLALGAGFRADAGLTATRADVIDTSSARLGGGWSSAGGDLDVAGWYRVGLLAYASALDVLVEHRLGVDAAWSTDPDLDVVVSVEGTAGPDVNAAILLVTAVWRPFP